MLRFVRSAGGSAGGCPAALSSRLAPPRPAAALFSASRASPLTALSPAHRFSAALASVCAPPHSAAGARRWASVSAAAAKQSKTSARTTTTTAAAVRRQASESQTLAAYTAALKRVPGQPAITPTSAPGDQRAYRVITLDNGMRCALVSDPLSERAAASLDLNVGSFSDPASLPGLANLCQRSILSVLSLSAAEDTFESHVRAPGGSSSAHIESEHSRLSFDVEHAHLEESLRRFAEAIQLPAFWPTGIDGVVDALQAEYQQRSRTEEQWRELQVLRATANPKHPFARFAEGNQATLRDEPKAAGVDVREELIKFHRAHYTPDRMSLAVSGRESLDQLEQMVRGAFGSIPAATKASTPAVKSKSADARIAMSAFTPAQLGRFVRIVPGATVAAGRLQFLWHFDSDAAHCSPYANDSLEILARILTSTRAGTNGLHSGGDDWYPEDLSWIDQHQANAEVLLSTSRFSLLSFTLELTEEGMKHNQEIVERVMGFIKHKLPLILQEELNEFDFEKIYRSGVDGSALFQSERWSQWEVEENLTAEDKRKDADARAGRFSPKRLLRITKASLPLVQRLSRALHVFPPERVVTQSTEGLDCPATVEHFVRLLNDPTRMRVVLTSRRLAEEAKEAGVTLSVERWGGRKYVDEPMPGSMVSYIVQPRRDYPGDLLEDGSEPTTNWRTLIGEALARHSETWSDVQHCTLNRAALSKRFRLGYSAWAEPFTLWTATRVYSDQEHAGAYFVSSRERHPPSAKEKQLAIASSIKSCLGQR